MPIYEYECSDCAHRFEVRQSFNDEPVARCPSCGNHARRLICPAPIIFKGLGFYVTDSRGPSTAMSDSDTKPSGDSKPTSNSKPTNEKKS